MKNVMFICTAGMSTSMLVSKVQEAADKRGVDIKVWASSEADAKSQYDNVDVILLGPQVRFLKGKVEESVADKPVKVDVIDMTNYGRMNGEAVLDQIVSLL